MKSVPVILGVVVSVSLVACMPAVSTTETPGTQSTAMTLRPVVSHQTSVDAVNVPAEFDVVQTVTEFAPGAFSTVHTHGGHGYMTVLSGEVTFRLAGGQERKAKAGETILENPGEMGQAGNSGTTPARYVITFLLPKGAALTTQQDPNAPAPAGQKTIARNTFTPTRPTGAFSVVQFMMNFAPGAATPVHTHGGEGYVTVLEGEITFRAGTTERTYKAGETFTERVNEVVQARNVGQVPASVVVTYLLPKGATLTTNQ